MGRDRSCALLLASLAALAGCRTAGPRDAGPPATAVARAPAATGASASATGPAFSPEIAAVVAQAQIAVAQARTLCQGGRVGFISLLDAERSLASAPSALAASDTQLSGDQVAIFLALGGGWEA
jgi:hypothetical protein